MSIAHWILLGWLAIGIVGAPLLVGKTRDYTAGYVSWMVVTSITCIILLVIGQS